MNRKFSRLAIFGTVSGLIWAGIAAALLNEIASLGEGFTVFVAGVVTGIITTFALIVPLRHSGSSGTVLLGLAVVPFSAFIYGASLSVVQLIVAGLTGTKYRHVQYGFAPVHLGTELAVLGCISIFALAFFPMAVLNTRMLKKRIVNLS